MTLGDMQAWLQHAVTAPDRPASLGPLAGTAGFPAAAGLGVYRRAYLARLTAAMRAQYPALCHALGPALFDDFTVGFLRRHPPQSHTLHDLGRRFAADLEAERPDRDAAARESWIDFVIDLARFERTVFALFDAPGAEGLPLVSPDVADESLRLQPAVRIERFGFNVAAYYHAVRRDDPAPRPERSVQHVALVRTDHVVRTTLLSAWEYGFLAAMADGGSVRDGIAAIAAASGLSDDDAIAAWQDARHFRDRWIGLGLFVAI